MSELLEVLDEQGALMNISAPRSEVHKKGLWHGTVHIYVYKMVGQEIEILVHLRSPHKDLYPNTWDPVLGGHIPAGRTPLQTAVEELNEEVGLSISQGDLMSGPILKADKGMDKELNHVFLCPLPSDAELHFKDREVQEVRWMGFDGVLQAIQASPSEWRPTYAEFSAAYPVVTSMLKG